MARCAELSPLYMAVIDAVEALCGGPPRDHAVLTVLEGHPSRLPPCIALKAAPHLMEWLRTETEHATCRRVALLFARLFDEAADDIASQETLFATARAENTWEPSEHSVISLAARKEPEELSPDDALTYACSKAWEVPAYVRGFCWSGSSSSDGINMDLMKRWIGREPMMSKEKLPGDQLPMRMAALLLAQLGSSTAGTDPQHHLLPGGAWNGLRMAMYGRPAVCKFVFESGAIDLAARSLRELGSVEDWMHVRQGQVEGAGMTGRAGHIVHVVNELLKAFAGEQERPDKAAVLASGILDMCIETIVIFRKAGAPGLKTVSSYLYGMSLR